MKRTIRTRLIFSWRRTIQIGVLATAFAVGLRFFLFVNQAAGTGAITISRPAGVEGFLPIGALMAWKRFLVTGSWDAVHPAAMVFLGFAVLISFFFRKSFCSWFCPVGTLSDACAWLGRRIFKRNFRLPTVIDIPVRGIKYALLGFFLWVIAAMPISQITAFLNSAYYRTADVRMLSFFIHMSTVTAVVLFMLGVASLFIESFWCRYLCPYGALLGILAAVGLTKIRRNPDKCTGCGQCTRACPHDLPVDARTAITSPECTGCMCCTTACPADGALRLQTRGINAVWTESLLGAVVIGSFVVLLTLAMLSGHWKSSLSNAEIRAGVHHLIVARYQPPNIERGYGH